MAPSLDRLNKKAPVSPFISHAEPQLFYDPDLDHRILKGCGAVYYRGWCQAVLGMTQE